jgi:CDP-diacylglycerol---glycerol-3-phosphate 3-phosphatidyltransferase
VLNVHGRAAVSRALQPLGNSLARRGVTADVVTAVGTIGATAAAVLCFPRGWFFGGALLITFFVLLDMVDGAVARASGQVSRFGALLDSTGDRVADAAVFGSLAWWFARHDQPWLLAATLLCLVLGALTSYIRARAEGLGLTATVGIAERAERLIVVLVGTGLTGSPFRVPYALAVAVWLLVAASAVTVGQRMLTVYRQDRQPAR